jgi:MFS family permease
MRSLLLLRHEPRARLFFGAYAQSSIGNGAGYVALLLLAYDRFRSPWALTLILLAEFLPPALLAPIMGAAADRWPRRRCLVLADLARAAAFVGLAFSGSFALTLALALAAGVGNALFTPTIMASLPAMVGPDRLPAATSLYGAIDELGYILGPGAGALALLVLSPAALLLANGASFAVSAAALACLRFGRRGPAASDAENGRSLLAETREAIDFVTRRGPLRALLASSTAFVVCLGMVNVGELLLARSLGASDAQFSVMVATMAGGIVLGSLLGSGGGRPAVVKARYLAGLLTCGVALVLAGSVPTFAAALPALTVVGIGNGVGLTHYRMLIQTVVPDARLGRVFGMSQSLAAWGMMLAFFAGGAAAALLGPRLLFIAAGAGALIAWSLAANALRGHWSEEPAPAPALATDAA